MGLHSLCLRRDPEYNAAAAEAEAECKLMLACTQDVTDAEIAERVAAGMGCQPHCLLDGSDDAASSGSASEEEDDEEEMAGDWDGADGAVWCRSMRRAYDAVQAWPHTSGTAAASPTADASAARAACAPAAAA